MPRWGYMDMVGDGCYKEPVRSVADLRAVAVTIASIRGSGERIGWRAPSDRRGRKMDGCWLSMM